MLKRTAEEQYRKCAKTARYDYTVEHMDEQPTPTAGRARAGGWIVLQVKVIRYIVPLGFAWLAVLILPVADLLGMWYTSLR